MPKVSVLMPAYNAEKYIWEAIESILNQSFTDFEFIIIDDGSTDASWEIIEEYAKKDPRIIAVKNLQNLWVSKTRNKWLDMAKWQYIALMDNDDMSLSDRLQKQYEYMENHPEIGVSGGTIEICDASMRILNTRTYHLTDSDIRKSIFYYSPFAHPATIWRRDILSSNQYNHTLDNAEDYDLYFRVGMVAQFGNLSDTLLRYRTNPNQISAKNWHKQEMLTLYVRIKAVIEYRYTMDLKGKIYWIWQFVSMYLISNRIKFWIFNFLRK